MNVLAIGAHFDDIELGCSGSLKKHVNNGDKVIIYVATKSGYSNPDKIQIRSNEEAASEGEASARSIGGTLICGGFETLNLEFEDNLNAELVRIIEREEIELIYTHYTGDVHHDHKALANASLHAGRHVPRILSYRSSNYQSDVPFTADFFIDITQTWESKEAAIRAHKTEFERTKGAWLAFFKGDAINNGIACGVGMAEGFKCVKWLQG